MARTFVEQWVTRLNFVPTPTTTLSNWQSSLLAMKQFLVGQNPNNLAGAWRVIGSSNGVVANSNDNWQATTDIVHSAASIPPGHSWILLRSPSGFMPGSNFFDMLIDCTPVDDATVKLGMANSLNPYDTTGATILNAPTDPTNAYNIVHAVCESSTNPQHVHMWRTQSGIFFIGSVTDGGLGIIDRGLACVTGVRQGERDLTDGYPGGFYSLEDLANGAWTFDNLSQSCYGWWINATQHDFAAVPSFPFVNSPASEEVFAYPAGVGRSSISTNLLGFPYDVWAARNATQPALQGYRGRVPDVLLMPFNTASNQFADTDTAAPLRLLSVQQLWLPVPNNTVIQL